MYLLYKKVFNQEWINAVLSDFIGYIGPVVGTIDKERDILSRTNDFSSKKISKIILTL